LSLAGLVRYLAEVERHWFQRCWAAGDQPQLYCTDAEPDLDFDGAEPANASEGLLTWEKECNSSRRSLPGRPRRGRRESLAGPRGLAGWILVHIIGEYARRNGHADLLRQTIDGSVGG